MRVLVACEESQAVTVEMRRLGHEAYSCDIQECSGGHPEWHLRVDALELLKMKWDMLIAFPPCTDLCVSGARWFAEKRADGRQQRSIEFFMRFAQADCPRIAIENPVGIMSSEYRKPDQIIQPYYFGDPVKKSTCLWLVNLEPLVYTNVVDPVLVQDKKGRNFSGPAFYAKDENGKIIPWNDPRTAKARSKTYDGIAEAMAEQWGAL